jgi:hypothetical protein
VDAAGAAMIALLLAALFAGQIDFQELLQRCLKATEKNSEMERKYTYEERTETRMLDSDGKVKSTQSETFEMLPTGGRTNRRRIAKNDVPIPQTELKKNRPESPAAEEERRRHDREMAREALNAFDFKMVGEDEQNWILEATPKPAYQPHNREGAVLKHFKGRIWISKNDYNWTKVDGEAMDEVTYGLVLIRLEPGAHLVMERTLVNGEVWLPKWLSAGGAARIMLVKKLRMEIETTCSKYKRFSSSSRMVTESVK